MPIEKTKTGGYRFVDYKGQAMSPIGLATAMNQPWESANREAAKTDAMMGSVQKNFNTANVIKPVCKSGVQPEWVDDPSGVGGEWKCPEAESTLGINQFKRAEDFGGKQESIYDIMDRAWR